MHCLFSGMIKQHGRKAHRGIMNNIKKGIFIVAVLFLAVSCAASRAKKKEDSGAHYRLGVAHLNDRNYSEALKELTTAVEMYPDDPSYHNGLGLAYFARSMNKEAIAQFKEAVRLDPKFSDAYLHLSAVYLSEKRWDEAIAVDDAAVKNIFYRTPELAYLNRGLAYFGKGDYKTAFESFRKAIEFNAKYTPAYYHMGLALDKMNALRDSIEAFKTAVSLDDAYVEAHYSLGLAYIKLKNKGEALKAFEKVITLAPQTDMALSARDYINLLK